MPPIIFDMRNIACRYDRISRLILPKHKICYESTIYRLYACLKRIVILNDNEGSAVALKMKLRSNPSGHLGVMLVALSPTSPTTKIVHTGTQRSNFSLFQSFTLLWYIQATVSTMIMLGAYNLSLYNS